MTAREPFSDATLEAMLQRRASRGDPGDLHERVEAELGRTRPHRILWGSGHLMPGFAPTGRLTPLIAASLLLALLVGALLVGASWLRQHETRISLVPTVVETMTPASLASGRLVEDGAGTLWMLADGQVTRLDPASGERLTWTVSDDTTFAAWVAGPARAGGVWIWTGGSVRRFTGESFAESIPASRYPVALDEAPDGTLWALSTDHGVQSWDGERWRSPTTAAPIDEPYALVAVGADAVWIAGSDPAATCGSPSLICDAVARLKDGEWTRYSRTESGLDAQRLVVAPDGTVWAGPTETGVLRFDGDHGQAVDGPEREPVDPLAVAPDGSLWAVQGGSLVRRDPDGSWTAYGDWLHPYPVTSVAATAQGVFAVTEAGFFRVEEDAWTPLWPEALVAPQLGSGSPGATALLGVSEREAWAVDGSVLGLWHFVGGTWQGPTQPVGFDHVISGLAIGPDGSLWATDLNRVAVLRSDGWTTAWASEDVLVDGGLVVGPDGDVWVGTYDGVATIRPVGSGFDVQQVHCPVPGATLAVARDGSIWVGGNAWIRAAGLAHVTGGRCERVDPRPAATGRGYEVRSVDADPRGGVIVSYEEPIEGVDWFSSDASVTSSVVRIADGQPVPVGKAVALSGSTLAAVAPSGAVWWAYTAPAVVTPGAITEPGGLARFDGSRWVQVIAGGRDWRPISISPDGTVWLASPAGIHRIRPDAQP